MTNLCNIIFSCDRFMYWFPSCYRISFSTAHSLIYIAQDQGEYRVGTNKRRKYQQKLEDLKCMCLPAFLLLSEKRKL